MTCPDELLSRLAVCSNYITAKNTKTADTIAAKAQITLNKLRLQRIHTILQHNLIFNNDMIL